MLTLRSVLFSIIIAGLFDIKSNIKSSSSSSFFEISNIATIKSLFLAISIALLIPIFSTILSEFLIPAVSIILTGIPFI